MVDTLKDGDEPKPDIIFIGINMTSKGGKDALAEIVDDEQLKEIPAFLLATSNDPEDIEDTFNNGGKPLYTKTSSFTGFNESG